MIGKALNSNNDIFLSGGSFRTTTDGALVAQHTRSRLLTYLGEYFLNSEIGVPYFTEVFIKPANLGNIESIVKGVILGTENVESIESFSMTYDSSSRSLSIGCSAITSFGVIDLDEVFINV